MKSAVAIPCRVLPRCHCCYYCQYLLSPALTRLLVGSVDMSSLLQLAHCLFVAHNPTSTHGQGQLSSTHTLSTVVPQWLVLEPLLFTIYTTSLDHINRSCGFSYHCYADDTQLYLSFQPDTTVSAGLSELSTWMREHHLQLNLSKTKLLVIPAQDSIRHNIKLNMGAVTVAQNKVALNLGIMIDDWLSFSDHIASVACVCTKLEKSDRT
ncbi:hypothetical protein ACEWY4_007294 [Coilia grayii]|uniref:Reverse transcriptase domain-containing protein n=1 Tax=Coilia grayii TaxID=363190 RepID=A0ABD1KG93_9TELE